jgi:hypothetical protein
VHILELRIGDTCRNGSGTQKCLGRLLATGKAPSGSLNYSTEVGGGCLATGKAPSGSPDYSAAVGGGIWSGVASRVTTLFEGEDSGAEGC